MERAFSLTDEEFSRIWTLASCLVAKGKGLEESLREATRLYTLEMPELMRQPGGLKVACQGEAEMRLIPRKGEPRSYTLVITTPGGGEEAPTASTPSKSAPLKPAPPRPAPLKPAPGTAAPASEAEVEPRPAGGGFHLTLIQGDRE